MSVEVIGGQAEVLGVKVEGMRRHAQDQGVRVVGRGAHAQALGVNAEVIHGWCVYTPSTRQSGSVNSGDSAAIHPTVQTCAGTALHRDTPSASSNPTSSPCTPK